MSIVSCLIAKNIYKNYGAKKALIDFSAEFKTGETVAIVGESGSGKSTLGRALCAFESPTSGEVHFIDKNKVSTKSTEANPRLWAQNVQMVFQNPKSALNPRRSVWQSVTEPLEILGLSSQEIQKQGRHILNEIELPEELWERWPTQLSGGQAQRVILARALAPRPHFLVCDEPVSALDLKTQVMIFRLLKKLQRTHNLGLILISHDLTTVSYISERIYVLQNGETKEFGNSQWVLTQPQSEYTLQLIQSQLLIPDQKM